MLERFAMGLQRHKSLSLFFKFKITSINNLFWTIQYLVGLHLHVIIVRKTNLWKQAIFTVPLKNKWNEICLIVENDGFRTGDFWASDTRAWSNIIWITKKCGKNVKKCVLMLLAHKPLWSIPANSLWATCQGSDNRGVITSRG